MNNELSDIKLSNVATLDDVLEAFRTFANSQAEKGRLFELLVQKMLRAISIDGTTVHTSMVMERMA